MDVVQKMASKSYARVTIHAEKHKSIMFHDLNEFNGRIRITSNSHVDLRVIIPGHFSYFFFILNHWKSCQ
jgi:hypothetical protein